MRGISTAVLAGDGDGSISRSESVIDTLTVDRVEATGVSDSFLCFLLDVARLPIQIIGDRPIIVMVRRIIDGGTDGK